MEVQRFHIEGPVLLSPAIHRDERGDFMETFSARFFESIGINHAFVQDNQSRSNKNVLRGLHFQLDPHAQGKLVRVTNGSVLDVIVDIRPGSPTCGQHVKVLLDDQSCRMLWVPPGFAHGFLCLTDHTVFAYKCTQYYNKSAESGILWNDAALGIEWGLTDPIVSEKDAKLPSFNRFLVEHSSNSGS